jgi:hypothetical protein
LPDKARIEQLRANVKAQESRLEEGIRMLNESKKKEQSKVTTATASSSSNKQPSQSSEWDPLERVIGLMDDLLTSYRRYSSELEKRVTKLDTKVDTSKRGK